MSSTLLCLLVGSFLSSLCSALVMGHYFILFLRARLASKVRAYVPAGHAQKNGTPTMGGLCILAVVCGNSFIWCGLSARAVWVIIASMISFGVIGLLDDWGKIAYQRGLIAKHKFIAQWTLAFASVLLLVYVCHIPTTVMIPTYMHYGVSLGFLFYFWASFIIVSTSNALNLTDGLDGLAATALIPVTLFFTALFLITSYLPEFMIYLSSPDVEQLAIFTVIVAGSLIGFLWYNTHPAQFFMGDVGSLSLGAGLALCALIAKAELLLPIVGAIFVLEVLSVIIQVLSVRYRGIRIFKMSPLHHHFELMGMHENSITVRAGIISLLLCCSVLYVLLSRIDVLIL